MTRRLALTDDNRRWWTLAAMCFALFMVMLDNTVVNVALPSIQNDLHSSIAGLQWTVNAYTLAFGVLLVTGGRLGDIFGRRRVFLTGVVIFAASSLFIGFSQSSAWLIGGRAAQGVGAALMMPATLSIITNVFPPHERGRAIGMWAGVSALALAIGPVLGGLLVEHVSWQSIFFINLPVAAGAIVVTLFATRESRDETVLPTVDFAGVAAITVGLTALTLALVEAGDWGWGSARVLALFALAAAGLAVFASVERRVAVPMVDFSFFGSRTFLGANIVAFIVSFAMLGMFFFLSLYMQNILRYSALEAGIRFLPTTLMVIVDRADRRPPDRPHRAASAHDGGPRARRRRAGVAVVSHPHLGLRLPAARLRADGHRHRARHVADDHRRDERRRPQQGRRRLGDPVDEPDDRRHARRRGARHVHRPDDLADGLRRLARPGPADGRRRGRGWARSWPGRSSRPSWRAAP